MDINEPSLMDVAHDTIDSTGRAFFVVGGFHEIYAGRRNQMKVEGPFDSLRGIAAPSHGAIPEPSSRRAGRARIQTRLFFGSPQRLLKVRLLPASTEEVYFVPPGGHIDRNPDRIDKNESLWYFGRVSSP
ncbi:hypothetical protein POPTR_007G061961v4 [Populus trichocarpa]|uniref:Uncharacterized protein n=1 Tax=Populus trichocarpa TaxID=3694 RepID=A0ACC0SPT4_POPTR|nr:hypothetical protein POPTR_007G061961v4 [Populus trichocarpa]